VTGESADIASYERLRALSFPSFAKEVAGFPLSDSLLAGVAQRGAGGSVVRPDDVAEPN